MKTQPVDSHLHLKLQAFYTKKKTQNENHLELAHNALGDFLTSGCKEVEEEPIGKSTRRALALNRKGIFACPKYTQFFNDDEDDIRIC